MKCGQLGILVVVGFAIAASVAAGCTDTHPTPGDKNTNWLTPCVASNECGGGLDCIADVCTRACDSIEDCKVPELALRCAAGVCAASTAMPMAGSSAPTPDASMALQDASMPSPTPDASMPAADASMPLPDGFECQTEEARRVPGYQRKRTMFPGPGVCSGTSLAGVISAIHAAYPDLADIDYVLDPDPTVAPPPIVISSWVKAFELLDGFAIVMWRGTGDCESGCTENGYWYFRTDENCVPQQVGHYRPQGSEASCMLEGYPMWDEPVPPADFPPACGAPVRARYLRDSYTIGGCGQGMACAPSGSGKTPESVYVQLQVQIDKSDADPSMGTVTLQGTRHEQLDGRPLPASFEGSVVRVSANESLPSTCLEQYSLEMLLDFDGNLAGYLHYEEARTPNCTNGGELCKGSLQLDFGRTLANASCFAEQDIATALEWARAPLLDCENDDDCTTVSFATECMGSCAAGVRADKAAELQATVQQVETAYCPGACRTGPVLCPALRAVCSEGKCTAATAVPLAP